MTSHENHRILRVLAFRFRDAELPGSLIADPLLLITQPSYLMLAFIQTQILQVYADIVDSGTQDMISVQVSTYMVEAMSFEVHDYQFS